jgi:hypothetical protein
MQGGHGESRGNLFPDKRSLVEMVKRFSARRTKRFDSIFEMREL